MSTAILTSPDRSMSISSVELTSLDASSRAMVSFNLRCSLPWSLAFSMAPATLLQNLKARLATSGVNIWGASVLSASITPVFLSLTMSGTRRTTLLFMRFMTAVSNGVDLRWPSITTGRRSRTSPS